ncbi:hypothetical protein F5146DRAFT_1123300 [Armillaria mellea]|nr:hypothetical protein F5146DRAFT_1123300 [Armillaria mellea]
MDHELRVQRDKFRQQAGKKRHELGKLQSEKEKVDCEVADLRRRESDLEEHLADLRAAAPPTPGFPETSVGEKPLPSPGPGTIPNLSFCSLFMSPLCADRFFLVSTPNTTKIPAFSAEQGSVLNCEKDMNCDRSMSPPYDPESTPHGGGLTQLISVPIVARLQPTVSTF